MPLALRGVEKIYGRHAVLRRLDLELRPGEIVGLVGANGSGKTTLFNLIVGVDQPDAGELSFAGAAVRRVEAPQRARIAHVAHATQLYPLLSGRENLELFADLRRSAGEGPRALDAANALARLGLAESAVDRPVQTYSRGMHQRTALARAVAARADLLVLDEPFTALDGPGRAQLTEVLLGEKERGAAILLSSHDLESLASVADRVVLLAEGRIAGEARGERGPQLRERATALLIPAMT